MIRISSLASSSKGNASVICTPECTLLVDAGISARRITLGLAECDLHPKQLDGVLFTHEHGDHCVGLGQLSKKHDIKVYCTRHTAHDLRAKAPQAAFTYIEPSQSFQIKDLRITPFSTFHDATDPVAYLFECGGTRLAYVTDTGKVSDKMLPYLQDLHGLYLESNYDAEMLQHSGRSHQLIQRIACQWGHLSNQQAAEVVEKVATPALQELLLGHLSQDCNTPQLALDSMSQCLQKLGLSPRLQCAAATHRTAWVDIQAPIK
ncbi:MAG: MBL fold metallo-hydrolase [Akkermansia sp.]